MPEFLDEWLAAVPRIDLALAVAVAIIGLLALLLRRRGGRFRDLPGWAGFWGVFAVVLIALSRLPRWASFPLLAGVMFAALRTYFFVAPVRPRDRYAILAYYLAIPFALWPAYIGSEEMFLATIPVSLFLFIPVFLAIGKAEEGLLDSMGRTLLGVLFFVFCLAHLGLLAHESVPGRVELFGVLVIAAELPQRLAGRFRSGASWWRPAFGVLVGLLCATALGWWFGPSCGLVDDDGARAGALVTIAATLGARVSVAVSEDLELTSPSARMGRGGLINRMVPAVYAAPVYFHYLNYFA